MKSPPPHTCILDLVQLIKHWHLYVKSNVKPKKKETSGAYASTALPDLCMDSSPADVHGAAHAPPSQLFDHNVSRKLTLAPSPRLSPVHVAMSEFPTYNKNNTSNKACSYYVSFNECWKPEHSNMDSCVCLLQRKSIQYQENKLQPANKLNWNAFISL